MKEITIDQIDEIKHNSKSVVLIYAEGCAACESTKPYFESIEQKYDQFYFYKLQFSEAILPFYSTYIPKEAVETQAKYDNGDPILMVDNKPLMIAKIDQFGQQVFESPIIFPNFFFFTNTEINENNEYGFVGSIPGFNKESVEYILNEMSTQTVINNG